MKWWEGLGKDNRGSRPRCVLLDGNRDEVAERLTQLVGFPGVAVSTDDKWMPYGKPVYKNGWWDDTPAIEVQLDKADNFISSEIQYKLHNWWLAAHRGARTPTWDIASTCKIMGKQGLLLFEAKAHENELSISGAWRATRNEEALRCVVDSWCSPKPKRGCSELQPGGDTLFRPGRIPHPRNPARFDHPSQNKLDCAHPTFKSGSVACLPAQDGKANRAKHRTKSLMAASARAHFDAHGPDHRALRFLHLHQLD